jgi:hypothetical protein
MSISKPWYLADYILPDEKRGVGLQHVKAAQYPGMDMCNALISTVPCPKSRGSTQSAVLADLPIMYTCITQDDFQAPSLRVVARYRINVGNNVC